LDAHGTDDDEQPWHMLKAHLAALRGTPCFSKCRFRLIPEANLGDQAQTLSKRAVAALHDVEIVSQYQHCYGIFTAPGSTERYVFKLREKLRDRAIRYHHSLVSANPFDEQASLLSRDERVALVRRKFERQMASFRMVFNVPKSILAKVGITYTGKAGKDNERTSRLQDDLCMALLFGFHAYTLLMADTEQIFLRDYRNPLVYQQNIH
jgi:hypothetical protein